MAINWKSLAFIGVLAYLGYTYRDKLLPKSDEKEETKEAEYTHYKVDGVEVHDYGSLENPVSESQAGLGRAVAQTASQANQATLAMSVSAVGQNFGGRAVGL